MIPWPIALLVILYAAIATASAASAWRAWQGWEAHSVWWPVFWMIACGAVALGLAWLKPWARAAAVWLSVLLVAGSLGSAWLAIAAARPAPAQGIAATLIAGAHLVVIRYLTRPRVTGWFSQRHVEQR